MSPFFFEGYKQGDSPQKDVYITNTPLTHSSFGQKLITGMRICDIPRSFISQNSEEIFRSLGELSKLFKALDLFIFKPLRDQNDAINTERRSVWPIFLRESSINNRDYAFHCNSKPTLSITHDNIETITNTRLERSLQNDEETHTIRVIYREQDPLLKILLSYPSRKNNIYFKSFAEGSLLAFSRQEVKYHRDVRDKITISQDSYLEEEDFFYLLEMIDLLKTLNLFRSNPDATYWRIQETPSLRCTIFGKPEKAREIHCVIMPEYNPGASGRLVVIPEKWHGFINDELHKDFYNNPEPVVDIRNEYTLLFKLLMEHWKFVKNKYSSQIKRNHIDLRSIDDYLQSVWEFEGNVDDWNAKSSPLPRKRVECLKKIKRISDLAKL